MKMLHLLMILEILHPIFGYTKGSVKEAALQVGGRNFIIFLMIEAKYFLLWEHCEITHQLFCSHTGKNLIY